MNTKIRPTPYRFFYFFGLTFIGLIFITQCKKGNGEASSTIKREKETTSKADKHDLASHNHEKEAPSHGHNHNAKKETSKPAHHHSAEHMKHMEAVRDLLKKNLGNDYNKPLAQASQNIIARGKKLYLKSCVSCHGTAGKGDGPVAASLQTQPADFSDAHHANYYSERGRLWIIRNGVPKTPMVGVVKTLGKHGTQQVYSYIRSFIPGNELKPKAKQPHDHNNPDHHHNHDHGHGHGHGH